ncbi:winged helix-turn-helix domain-containing protein [Paenibacillus sp. BR2-3]|uniref:winged helix-turn-helix domain-containing protein n=1 Tax=Paenibacillus sp. BR2-3 TaxID=3048494 RepID=UPI00397747E8
MKETWVDLFPKRIWILHSDRTISSLLRHGLINQGYMVSETSFDSGHSVPACDLLLLDSKLNDKLMFDEETYKRRMGSPPILEIGKPSCVSSGKWSSYIVDYIQTPIEFPELIQKITSALHKNSPVLHAMQISSYTKAFRVRDIEIYPDQFEIKKKDHVLTLSNVEMDLFIQLVQHLDSCISVLQLQKTSTAGPKIKDKTIKNHIITIRKKLDVFQGELDIQTIRNKGYRLVWRTNEGLL